MADIPIQTLELSVRVQTARRRLRLDPFQRMVLGYMTCTAMSGNGCTTATATTTLPPLPMGVLSKISQAASVSCVAAVGTAIRPNLDRLIGSVCRPRTGIRLLVSVWPRRADGLLRCMGQKLAFIAWCGALLRLRRLCEGRLPFQR